MRHLLIAFSVFLLATCSGSVALADQSFLGNAAGFNEFILGSSSSTSTRTGDSLGQVAYGGNVAFNNFSVGSGVNQGNLVGTNAVIVGGQLGGSQLVNGGPGNELYGSLQAGTNVYNNGGGSKVQGSSSTFFASAATTLISDSNNLAAQTANGTISTSSGVLSLTGTLAAGTTTNTVYFNLTAAQLTGATGLTISITDNNGTTPVVIVNVSGSSVAFTNSYTSTYGGVTENNILYNFQNATTLSLNGNPFYGTILAPMAAITANSYGQVNGEVIGASFSGNIETHSVDPNSGHYDLFNGSPTLSVHVVPEPATIVSTLTGLTIAGGAAWRRRRRRIA